MTNISVCWRRIFLSRYSFSNGTSGHFWMSASPKKFHVLNQNGTPGQERDRKLKDNYLKYKRVSRCPVCPVQKHTGRSCVCFCRYALAVWIYEITKKEKNETNEKSRRLFRIIRLLRFFRLNRLFVRWKEFRQALERSSSR